MLNLPWQSYLKAYVGLNGSISSVIFVSVLPSSFKIIPQKMIKPFAGTDLYSFNFSLVEVIADCTEFMVCLDLMLEAYACS